MDEHIYPNEQAYHRRDQLRRPMAAARADRGAEAKGKGRGLVESFLARHSGLSNLEYAPLAEMMGRVVWAARFSIAPHPTRATWRCCIFTAPTGTKGTWLEPLLAGEIRSCFSMTEPDVASSDATNIRSSITATETIHSQRPKMVVDRRRRYARASSRSSWGRPTNRPETSAAVDDPRPDGHARRQGGAYAQRLWLRRRTKRPRRDQFSKTSAFQKKISCSAKAAGLRSHRDGSAPAAFITACVSSASPRGLWN